MNNKFNLEIIDCQYFRKNVAASFLLYDQNEAVFIENNTTKALPHLLEAMKKNNVSPEDIKYIIITHVHLDHAGGTAALLEKCPNATVIAHPKAVRHLASPSRLVSSAKLVYGEERFDNLYGEIKPVSKEKIIAIQDNEVLTFGNRKLKFLHTEGHAKHHICIYDNFSNGVFTGDTFGIAYPELQVADKKFLFPTSSPTDFSPEEALISLQKIKDTNADKAFLTHFGLWNNLEEGMKQMKSGLLSYEKILKQALNIADNEKREKFCIDEMREYMRGKLNRRKLDIKLLNFIDVDIRMNAMGISYVAQRMIKKKKK